MILEEAVQYGASFQKAPETMFEKFDHSITCIVARYGDNPPPQAPIFEQSFRGNIFDTYGHGNVHNSIHQWKGGKYWNRPIPFPADLRKIESYLKKNSGKVLRLGQKSDPFMWMDHTYSVTKFTLELALKYDVQLSIQTMSDLCAHDDYLDLIKQGNHQVVIHFGFEEIQDEQAERVLSPGAPSLKRRFSAFQKLKDAGVDCIQMYSSVHSMNKKEQLEFKKRMGCTVEAYLRSAVMGAK